MDSSRVAVVDECIPSTGVFPGFRMRPFFCWRYEARWDSAVRCTRSPREADVLGALFLGP